MQDKIKESQQYYDKLAKRFDRSLEGFFTKTFKKAIIQEVNIQEKELVLDVGCANGELLHMLKRKQGNVQGVGLDISSKMVEIARKRYPDIQFEQGNAQCLPYEKETFDWVICSASFHHFPDPSAFLKEAYRVLKKGGKLLIAEIHFPSFGVPFYNYFIQKFNKEGDVKIYRPQELQLLLKEGNFSVDEKVKYKVQVQLHIGVK